MEQKNKDIDHLLISSFVRNISQPEKQLLDRWIKESPENREQYELLKRVWQERSQDRKFIHSDEILDKVWDLAKQQGHKPRFTKNFSIGALMKIAAVFLFLAAAIYLLLQNIEQPGQTKAVEANLVIKSNHAGQKSRIKLSDGSVVWLNASSSVSYLENFTPGARSISLDGEAFFEVVSDTLRPFIVNTGKISTTALGTSFNIKAYHPEKLKIALVTGHVKVMDERSVGQPYYLNPGMGLEFNKNNEVQSYSFDVEKIMLWKSGILLFDGEGFEEFKETVERWYGIALEVDGQIPVDWSIKGHFENESLENVMASISFNKKLGYEINGKILTLKFQ